MVHAVHEEDDLVVLWRSSSSVFLSDQHERSTMIALESMQGLILATHVKTFACAHAVSQAFKAFVTRQKSGPGSLARLLD